MGVFRFKQFSVNDDGATMKVGTDAVLLGAWCPVEGAKRILDIGTGCGVIALMLAQRSSTDAHIDAVELEDHDARQAGENVMNSPWPKKVSICQERIQNFQAPRYDLIVCNPPFFSQSLLPPDPQRARVRHDHALSREDLLKAVIGLLAPTGTFCLILPALDATSFIISAKAAGLYLQKHTQFHSRSTKPAERSLLSLAQNPGPGLVDDLVLYGLDDRQTMAYRNLTGDFYL